MKEGSFSTALDGLKQGGLWFRLAWKNNKFVRIDPEKTNTYSHLVMEFTDGRKNVPWTPTRCDLLEEDWRELIL